MGSERGFTHRPLRKEFKGEAFEGGLGGKKDIY
jgi:hypothetical protein